MPASRVTLPSEFFDIVSPMMLVQPEPQRYFAQMIFASNARAELAGNDAGSFFNSRSPLPSSGAPVMDLAAQQLMLARAPLGEAIAVVAELGHRGVGHTIRINRPVFSGGGYTEASRVIAQSTSISTTPIEIGAEQVSITVKRVAGPYASSGTAVQPYAIDRFDAGKSVHALASLVGLHLRRDRMTYLDTVVGLLYDSATTNIVRAGNLTADNQFPASGQQPLDLDTLLRAVETLSNANIPRFADGRYMAILSPTQIRQLKTDPEWASQAKEDVAYNLLTGGDYINVGTDLKIAQSNTIQRDTATVSGATIQRGLMFGPGAIGYGLDDACRVAAANEDNYGETAKVIWLAYEGLAMLDETFICGVRSV